jgi:hypothetical protein
MCSKPWTVCSCCPGPQNGTNHHIHCTQLQKLSRQYQQRTCSGMCCADPASHPWQQLLLLLHKLQCEDHPLLQPVRHLWVGSHVSTAQRTPTQPCSMQCSLHGRQMDNWQGVSACAGKQPGCLIRSLPEGLGAAQNECKAEVSRPQAVTGQQMRSWRWSGISHALLHCICFGPHGAVHRPARPTLSSSLSGSKLHLSSDTWRSRKVCCSSTTCTAAQPQEGSRFGHYSTLFIITALIQHCTLGAA